jgi:hypothetical protein
MCYFSQLLHDCKCNYDKIFSRGDVVMKYIQIQVRYKNGVEGLIDSPSLENLIESREISHFRRSNGWVSVEHAKTRRMSGLVYSGHERRRDNLSRQGVFLKSKARHVIHGHVPVSGFMLQYWSLMSKLNLFRRVKV